MDGVLSRCHVLLMRYVGLQIFNLVALHDMIVTHIVRLSVKAWTTLTAQAPACLFKVGGCLILRTAA